MDPAAAAEPLIAEDVKADICTRREDGRSRRGCLGGKREEGTERTVGVCCTPVCLS